MPHLARATTVMLLLLAAACSPPESGSRPEAGVEVAPRPVDEASIPDPFAYTDELLERRETMRRIEGDLVMGDASARFVAWLEEGEPVLIEESVSLGDYGNQNNRYALASGQLVLYEHSATRTITDPSRPPGSEEVESVLTFDVDGSPRYTAMTVDGDPVEVEEAHIRGALARTATLRRAALDAVARSSEP